MRRVIRAVCMSASASLILAMGGCAGPKAPAKGKRPVAPPPAAATAITAPVSERARELGAKVAAAIYADDPVDALKHVEDGADVNYCDMSHPSGYLLYLTTFSPDMLDVAKALVARGADVNRRCMAENTPLHNACGQGFTKIVEFLLANGADVNATDSSGCTPLHYTAIGANANATWDACDLLISQGADVNAQDAKGRTPRDLSKNKRITALLAANGGKRAWDLPTPSNPVRER